MREISASTGSTGVSGVSRRSFITGAAAAGVMATLGCGLRAAGQAGSRDGGERRGHGSGTKSATS